MKISKRLESCARYTDGFLNLADIGTDHALLPILCVKQGYVYKAQAIDNKEGPFVIAFSNVKKHDLLDKIKVVLGDGISKIADDTDVVVVSGMGGELIANILKKDSAKNVKRFILQPNNNAEAIRRILPEIGYFIIDELVLEDQKKIYDIIVLEKGESHLSEEQMTFGPVNLRFKPHYFIKKLNMEVVHLDSIRTNIKDPIELKRIDERITSIKEVL